MSGEAVSCLNTSNPFSDGKALLSPYYVMDLFYHFFPCCISWVQGLFQGFFLSVCMLSPIWLSDLMYCSLPGSSVYGILQARILEWFATSFSRGSSWPRDGTRISCFNVDSLPLNHMGSPGFSLRLDNEHFRKYNLEYNLLPLT